MNRSGCRAGSRRGDLIGGKLLSQRHAKAVVELQPKVILALAAFALLVPGGQRDQRHGGIVKPQIDRNRVVVPGSTVEQVNVIAKVLLNADAGVQVMKPRQPL